MKRKYQVGDKVRVVVAGIHNFSVGSLVTIAIVGDVEDGTFDYYDKDGHHDDGYPITMDGYVDRWPKPERGTQGGYSWQVELVEPAEGCCYKVGWAE